MKQNFILSLLTILILFLSLLIGPNKKKADISTYRDQFLQTNKNFSYITNEQLDFLKRNGATGKGIKIAIIDSPIQTSEIHIEKTVTITTDESSQTTDLTHGTTSALILKKDIAPDVLLYSIESLNSMGIGTYEDVIKGIEWCIEQNMDIITFSLTGYEYSKELHQSIQKAKQHNILLIAAAGNNSSSLPSYPAAFWEVISVGALDVNDHIASYSNFGEYVDIYALGDIEKYGVNGTSFSVPFVAGYISLLKETFSLTNNEIFTLFTHLP